MAEGRAAPLASFPSPTCHLVCPASPEPLCRSPRSRRGPLAALKSRAGRRWCWAGHDVRGRGQREHGRAQSLRAQPGSCPLGFWHAWCFSSSQCGRGEIDHLTSLFPLNLLILMADSPCSPSHLAEESKWLVIHILSPQSRDL